MNPSNITGNLLAIQEMRSQGLGVVQPTPAGPAFFSAPETLQYLSYSIPVRANGVDGSVIIAVPGNYMYVDSIYVQGSTTDLAADLIRMKTDKSDALIALPLARMGYTFNTNFSFIELRNGDTVNAATITLWIGRGFITDNRQQAVQTVQNAAWYQFNFVRPNNIIPYAAGNMVNSNPAVVHPFAHIDSGSTQITRQTAGSARITAARMVKVNSTTTANAAFRLWLYNNTVEAFTIVDQAAFAFMTGVGSSPLPIIEFPAFISAGGATNGAFCRIDGLNIPFNAAIGDDRMWGNLEARGAYVPIAFESFTVQLFIERIT